MLRARDAGFEFLLRELDLALTFVSVAKATAHRSRRIRNRGYASEACEVVSKFRHRLKLSAQQEQELSERLSRLESLIASVPEP